MTPRVLSTLTLLAAAAAAAGAAEKLTLEDALRLAEENHPHLRASAAQIEGARWGIVTAKAYPNPEAGYLAGNQHARVFGALPGLNQVYSFTQPIETPAVRRYRLETAEMGRDSSQYGYDEARVAIRTAVKQTFHTALRRKAEIEIVSGNLRLVEDLQRRIRLQVQVGEAPRLELTRADAEVAVARTLAKSAELRLVTALAALRAAISAPLADEIDPQGDLAPPAVLPSLEALRTEVLETYPALKQARAEVRRAEARVKNETALRTPQPSLRGEYEQQPDIATYRVGLSLPVPVWNRRQGPIGEAEAALKQAAAAAEWRRVEVIAALEGAYGRYQVAGQQVSQFETGVLKQAEAALQAAEAAYRFGERGVLEVLDAQRVLRGARLDFLNAQFDRQTALNDLEQLRAAGAGKVKP